MHGGAERIGALDDDLGAAVARALGAGRRAAAVEARHYSWDRCTQLFLAGLASPTAKEHVPASSHVVSQYCTGAGAAN